MIKSVVAISNGTELKPMTPYVYNGTAWVKVFPKVYIDGWKDIGGTGFLMWNFLEHSGLLYNSTDNILVRNPLEITRFLTSDNKVFNSPSVVSSNPVNMRLTTRPFYGKTLIDNQSKTLKESQNKTWVVGK